MSKFGWITRQRRSAGSGGGAISGAPKTARPSSVSRKAQRRGRPVAQPGPLDQAQGHQGHHHGVGVPDPSMTEPPRPLRSAPGIWRLRGERENPGPTPPPGRANGAETCRRLA